MADTVDGFVRRYNADLANDFGNLVNRSVSMANRYLEGRTSRDETFANWAIRADEELLK